MKIIYAFCLIFIVLKTSILAQNKPIHQIGLLSGLTYEAIKSDAYSPLILSGISLPATLFYQKIKDNRRYKFEIGAMSIHPSEKFNTSIDDTNGHLSFEWLKAANRWQNIQFHFGFIGLFEGSHRYNITRKLGNNNEAAELSLTLNAVVMAEWFQNNHRLTAQLNYAVIGYQSAILYALTFADKRVLTPANLFQINGSVRYNKPISSHFNFIAGYQFYLYRSDTPQYLGILKHHFELGTAFVF